MEIRELDYIPNLFIHGDVCSDKQIPVGRINIDKIPAFIPVKDYTKSILLKDGTLLISLAKEELVQICNRFPKEVPIKINKEGEEVGIAGTTIKLKAITVSIDKEEVPKKTDETLYDALEPEMKNKLKELGWCEYYLKLVKRWDVFNQMEKGDIDSKNCLIKADGEPYVYTKLSEKDGVKVPFYDALSDEDKNKLKELGWKEEDLKRVVTMSIITHLLQFRLSTEHASINEKGYLNRKVMY